MAAETNLTLVTDKTFGPDADITLDGNRFTRCQFHGCTVRYGGGDVEFIDTEIRTDCAVLLTGAAGTTVAILRMFGWTDLTRLANITDPTSSN